MCRYVSLTPTWLYYFTELPTSLDPMHGNTKTAKGGLKTRAMPDIVSEISSSILIHASLGSTLGGIHLELTGDLTADGSSVTECIGGAPATIVEAMRVVLADIECFSDRFYGTGRRRPGTSLRVLLRS